MTSFAPGQVVTVFRSRLRADAAPGYVETSAELLDIARQSPGFVDYKTFKAEDGEQLTLVTFDGPDSQLAWRQDERHRAAQQRGRDVWYAEYSIQVADCTSTHLFVAG
jgi:heme-degrading monooxygenase HmoA